MYCARDRAPLTQETTYAPASASSHPPPGPSARPAAASPVFVGALAGGVVVLAGLVGFLWIQRGGPPAPSAAEPYAAVAPAEMAPVQAAPPPKPLVDSAATGDQYPATFDARAPAEGVDAPAPPARTLQRVGTPRPEPSRSSASYGPARVVTDGVGLLLRAGPGQGYAAIGKMLQGDVVTVNGCSSGPPGRRWCDVVYGGVRAYAHDEFLSIGEPTYDSDSGHEQAFAAARIVNQMTYVDGSKVSYVNLREQPTVQADVTLRMRPGTSAHVQRCLPRGWSLGGRAIAGSWCFVTAAQDGRTVSGWASDDALFW